MIEIIKENCTGCGKCIKACPFGAIKVVDKIADIQEGCTLCGACVQICTFAAIEIERKAIEERDLSGYKDVWVFAETLDNQKIRSVTFELLSKGKELATDLTQNLCAVLLGRDVKGLCKDLAAYGAQKVYLAENEYLEQYTTDAFASVLSGLISKYQPNIVLYPATHLGRDLAPRVAATLEVGLTADCTGLSIQDGLLLQTRPAFGGNIMADIICLYTRPQMATVRPNVMKKCEPDYNLKSDIIAEKIELDPKSIRTVIKEKIKTSTPGTPKIDEADIIVSGGRGLGSKEGFGILQNLADILGGVVGASRVAIDCGWKPKSVQVGQSGITVSPKLYFACGISGAIQHLVGMRGSDVIVAINKNSNAPIFEFAKYGIAGDFSKIIPAITEEIKRVKAMK